MRSGLGRVGDSRWFRTVGKIWVEEVQRMGVVHWQRAPVVCLGMHIVRKRLIPGTKDDCMSTTIVPIVHRPDAQSRCSIPCVPTFPKPKRHA